ncbi:MAG: hypothetical protein HYT27_00225 [Parcubacteria group bacterium]|nr:hypothetical protein [Parcubacteria group bacterium]
MSVSVEEYAEPFVQVGIMEETQNGEAWTGYKEWKKVSTDKNDWPAQFNKVPYGSFSVFVDIDSCGGMRIGNFTFEKPIRTVEVHYNAKKCAFSFGFSQ